jgi:protein phosphatase
MSSDEDTADFDPRAKRWERFFAPPPIAVRVEYGAASHPGIARPNNEDCYAIIRRTRSSSLVMSNVPLNDSGAVEEHAYLMYVADGMGGAAFGEVASSLSVRTIWEVGPRVTKWVMRLNEYEVAEVKERVHAYAQQVRLALRDHAAASPDAAGMGTTLAFAYSIGSHAFVGNVGDSRVYLCRNGAAEQITRDHTLAQELMDDGVAPERALKFRSRLTRCVSADAENTDADADVHLVELGNGDDLLLCTDGLSDLVDDSAIGQIVGSHRLPQDACRALVEAALDRGGTDNVTVVLARFEIPAAG